MASSNSYQALAALLVGGLLLSSCGGNASNTPTSTPSSMLGTDSAATKVGGTAPAMSADSAGMGSTTGAPGAGTSQPTTPTGH